MTHAEHIIPPTSEHARLVERIKEVIVRRRQVCYGGLALSDAQVDELSRAISQRLVFGWRMYENDDE